MMVLQYEAGIISWLGRAADNIDLDAADVNKDGDVNSTDAMLILQYEANLIGSFNNN